MVLERENCQDLVTGEMGLVRKRKELRVTARFWLGNQWTKSVMTPLSAGGYEEEGRQDGEMV